jgi:hypothetical protein
MLEAVIIILRVDLAADEAKHNITVSDLQFVPSASVNPDCPCLTDMVVPQPPKFLPYTVKLIEPVWAVLAL